MLDAVAARLRLQPAEPGHLYRLAEVPGVPTVAESVSVPA